MVSVFGKIMHAEFALCKNYDFASLKYDRIGTYSANFCSICAGRRIQFEPKSRAEIRSAGRYRRTAWRRPPWLEPCIHVSLCYVIMYLFIVILFVTNYINLDIEWNKTEI